MLGCNFTARKEEKKKREKKIEVKKEQYAIDYYKLKIKKRTRKYLLRLNTSLTHFVGIDFIRSCLCI